MGNVRTWDGVIVQRIPRIDRLKLKHAPIPTYMLFIQRQHDTVSYIQVASASAQISVPSPFE